VLRCLASELNEWVSQVLGVPRADGSLPDSVERANTLAVRVAKLGETAALLGKDVGFECPVSRAKGSQFEIKGREDHAEMFTHPSLAKLEADYAFRRIYFDQSMLGSEFEKTTQLIATPRLYTTACGRVSSIRWTREAACTRVLSEKSAQMVPSPARQPLHTRAR
jgi:hypothetical protein